MDLLHAISNGHRGADCDHGVTFGIRRGQAGDQVGAARPRNDQYYSRSPGHAAYAGSDDNVNNWNNRMMTYIFKKINGDGLCRNHRLL